MRPIVLILVALFSVPAFAEKSQPADDLQCQSAASEAPAAFTEAAAAEPEIGFCVGLATRCDLLPKGICYMQQGCMNPFGPYAGDRCTGTARQCTGFARKNTCMMQRGCTWAASKKKPAKAAPEAAPETAPDAPEPTP